MMLDNLSSGVRKVGHGGGAAKDERAVVGLRTAGSGRPRLEPVRALERRASRQLGCRVGLQVSRAADQAVRVPFEEQESWAWGPNRVTPDKQLSLCSQLSMRMKAPPSEGCYEY